MALKDLDNIYDQTAQAERKSGPLPDGNYEARIDRVELTTTSSGNDMLVVETIVATGQFAGHKHTFNRVLTENTLAHAKADLNILGWKGKLSDLEDHNKLAILLDLVIKIAVRTKGQSTVNGKTYDNKNTYINGLIKGNGSVAVAAPAPAPVAAPAPAPMAAVANSRTSHVQSGITRTTIKAPKNGSDEPPF